MIRRPPRSTLFPYTTLFRSREVSDADLAERRAAVTADDLATLIYTSGTTGRPKGCEITHRNLLFEIRAAGEVFGSMMQEGNRTLLFLPLAHIFARVVQDRKSTRLNSS